MKIKYTILYLAVAVAFAAVSAWVFLSGGSSAKAIRSKFRLGGLLLTIGGILGIISCSGCSNWVSCYDVAMPLVSFTCPDPSSNAVSAGDSIIISVSGPDYETYLYRLEAVSDGVEIQSGTLEFDEKDMAAVVIGETSFKGSARLAVYGVIDEKEYFQSAYELNIK